MRNIRSLSVDMIRRALVLGLITLTMVAPSSVRAHAIVESVTPVVNGTVPGPDVAVILRFNSRLDRERSRLTLKTPDGTSLKLSVLPPADATPGEQATLSAKATGLTPGKYVLNWQVLAVDGHLTRGNVPFTVGGR